MINRTLARRLAQLESCVAPNDVSQTYMRIHSISPDGELVKTLELKIDSSRAVNTQRRRSRLCKAVSRLSHGGPVKGLET
jgi:hypothetical protein